MGMDSPKGQTPANDLKVRERTSSLATNISRESSMASSGRATPYHERMDDQMDCDSEPRDMTPGLSYETEQEKTSRFNRALETTGNTRPQGGSNEATYSTPQRVLNENQNIRPSHVEGPHGDNSDVTDIQLPYNPNAPTEPDLWSGNFHPISLHGSIKQIAFDTKSIKDSLNFMAKYIKNKKIKASKTNDLSDFDGLGDFI